MAVEQRRVETSNSSVSNFLCSKAGFWKLLVLIGGCATFALYADSERYLIYDIKTYVLAAYIISWGVSLLIFFARITGLSIHLNSPCWSFDSIDYFWSWLSSLNFVACSVILACYFNCSLDCNGRFCPCVKELTAMLVGFVTALIYVCEAQNLRLYAPIGTAYGTTWLGIWRMIILVVGATAFGLLIATGYVCGRGDKTGCTTARTFVLAAWCTAWGVAALMYLLHICGLFLRADFNQQTTCSAFEFFWSAFACLLYLTGAAVYAAYLGCSNFKTNFDCRSRLATDICGFVTAVLFAIDAYSLRNHRPSWFVRTTASSSGGNRVVTTRTTETRRVAT